MKTLNTTGIKVSDKFPSKKYTQIHSILTKKKNINEDAWKEHSMSWNALSFRYALLSKYNNEYIINIKTNGNAPKPDIRIQQEEIIFNFFVVGFSIIDIMAYSLYSTSSFLKPSKFPLNNKIKPNIQMTMVKDKMNSNFRNENITKYINNLILSKEYKDWKDIRNILAHRGQPPRHHYLGGDKDGLAEWVNGIVLDKNTLSANYRWINLTIKEFINNYLILVKKI